MNFFLIGASDFINENTEKYFPLKLFIRINSSTLISLLIVSKKLHK